MRKQKIKESLQSKEINYETGLTDEQVEGILDTVIKENKFYNLKTHEYEDFESTGVINSVDTDIQIMRSCISLMGLLATSNQIITINYNIMDQVNK